MAQDAKLLVIIQSLREHEEAKDNMRTELMYIFMRWTLLNNCCLEQRPEATWNDR